MLTQNSKTEPCRQLVAELPWNHITAARSARIVCAKALFDGVNAQELFELVESHPRAEFVRETPTLLPEAWFAVHQASDPDNNMTKFEKLLNDVN